MIKVTAQDAGTIHKVAGKARGFASLDYCVKVAKENGFWERIEPTVIDRDRTLRGLNGLVYWTNGKGPNIPVEGGYWTVEANNKRVFVKATNLCNYGFRLVVDDD